MRVCSIAKVLLLLLAPGAARLSTLQRGMSPASSVEAGAVSSWQRVFTWLLAAVPSLVHVGVLVVLTAASVSGGYSQLRLLVTAVGCQLALVAAQWLARSDADTWCERPARALWPGLVQSGLFVASMIVLFANAMSLPLGPYPGVVPLSSGDFITRTGGLDDIGYGTLAVVWCDEPEGGIGLARVHAMSGDTIWINDGRVCSDDGCVPQRSSANSGGANLEVMAGHYYLVIADPTWSTPPSTVGEGEFGLVADIRTPQPSCLSKLTVSESRVVAVAQEAWPSADWPAPVAITLE